MDILSMQVVLSNVEGGMGVAEMFSPPRVNIQAARLGMSTGWSMDIGTTDPWSGKAWDLSDRRCQALALKLVCQHQPKFLMLSPPCTLFSTLQNLNPGKGTPAWQTRYDEAVELLRFCCMVAATQVRQGRYFALEHPQAATSWTRQEMKELGSMTGVSVVDLDMCAYNLKCQDADGEGAARKATRLMSNSPCVPGGMNARCTGNHRHVHLLSGKAGPAARYTEEFCST